MHNKKRTSWKIKATKTRPNRAFIWNDTYQQGCYLLWPVDGKTLKREFESVQPLAKKQERNYSINRGCARFIAVGNVSCMAFGDKRPGVDIVAHECYHFTNYEMEFRGVPHKDIGDQDDSEARAYFLQWAVREVARTVNAKVF